jgi:hypothetical protein
VTLQWIGALLNQGLNLAGIRMVLLGESDNKSLQGELRSAKQSFVHGLLSNKKAMVGAFILFAFIALALMAPWLFLTVTGLDGPGRTDISGPTS